MCRFCVIRKLLWCCLLVLSWCFFTSCTIDFDNLFSKTHTSNRGYTLDELELFYNFAKLATIEYNNLDKNHLDELGDKLSHAVRTHTIEYSSKYQSEDITSSAAIAYPQHNVPNGGWPLLISVHHTLLKDDEAPTILFNNNGSFSFENIADFDPNLHPLLLSSSLGFVVYAPDLLGFGSSREKGHPFMNKDMLVYDIMQGLEASIQSLQDMDIAINTQRIFITGYSHGAWLATQVYRALNTDPVYSGKYNVEAGVSSAGVYNLHSLVVDLLSKEKSGLPLFFPYMLYGYEISNTLAIDYSEYYKEPYASLDFAGDLFNGINDNKYVDNKLSSRNQELYHDDFINGYGTSATYRLFREQLRSDTVTPWKLSGKYLLIHHEDDEVAEISQIDTFVSDMKAVLNQTSDNVETHIGRLHDTNNIDTRWGDPNSSAHEATAIVTYITGLYWLVEKL